MLSVVIPTRNEGKYLPILLDSIKTQTHQPAEIIVADADSTDNTRKVAISYGCQVVQGGYAPAGRNVGAYVSRGDTVCFVDADIALPRNDYLETALKEFTRRELDVAGVLVRHVSTGYNLKDTIYGSFYGISNVGLILCEYTKKPFMQSLMFARHMAFDEIGGFPYYEFGEDSAFASAAVAKGFRFGILRTPPPAYISPRRLERWGVPRILRTYLYFNVWRMLGREFMIGETGEKYYDEPEVVRA